MVDQRQMKRTFLIGVLAFGFALAGFLVSSKPESLSKLENQNNTENPVNEQGMPFLTALPIFYSNSAVNSEAEVLALFS